MLTYQKLARNPSSLRSFTGLAAEEFDRLYEIAESQYPAYELERLDRKNRINAIGQGRNFKLALKDKLVMLLMYYRLYITYELEGFLFDLDQGNVCRNIRHIEPLVKRCIPLPEKVHRKPRRSGQ